MVEARDKGVPALKATAILRLQIRDLNDEKPRFTSVAPLRNVSENAEIGKLIVILLS